MLSRACGRTLATEPSSQKTAELPAMQPLKILLAEDGKANQVLALGLLKKWGHQVDVAEDGQQALQLTADNSFDLVLMDVQMPVMDGLEATRQIRRRERQSGGHLLIVAMTARAMKGDRQECLDAGMDEYVAKPIRRKELAMVLSKLFDSGGVPASQESTSDVADHSDALIPWQTALDNTNGDADVLHDVVMTAFAELPELLAAIQQSLKAQDLTTVARMAHTIKSTSGILAATATIDAARAVEQAASAKEQALCESSTSRLVPLVHQLVQEIQAYLERVDGDAGSLIR